MRAIRIFALAGAVGCAAAAQAQTFTPALQKVIEDAKKEGALKGAKKRRPAGRP